MSNEIDLKAARYMFAGAIAKCGYVPDSAEITIRDDAELGEAAAFHCRWPLAEKGPYSDKYSREITVKIASRAMNHFRAAAPEERAEMLGKFGYVLRMRWLDGQYNERDSSSPPFIIEIDEHSLEQ